MANGTPVDDGVVLPVANDESITQATISVPERNGEISADEIALYDRQIRLWGLEAQQKLRNANVLLITVKAFGNEIAKNLVLGGVASVTLLDNELVSEDDLGAQFLLTENDIGKPRAAAAKPALQKLNSKVSVFVEANDPLDLEPLYFSNFSVTIATDLPNGKLNTLNAMCRLGQCPFYAAGSHGLYGFVFADLIEHTFAISREKSNIPTVIGPETPTRSIVSATSKRENGKVVELVTKMEIYQPLILANTSPLPPPFTNNPRRLKSVSPLLPCLRALWEFEQTANRPLRAQASTEDLRAFTAIANEKVKELQLYPQVLKAEFLRNFLQNLYTEFNPTCAFLGAQLAQDVINVVCGKEQPIQNLLLFDGDNSEAPVYALYPMVPSV